MSRLQDRKRAFGFFGFPVIYDSMEIKEGGYRYIKPLPIDYYIATKGNPEGFFSWGFMPFLSKTFLKEEINANIDLCGADKDYTQEIDNYLSNVKKFSVISVFKIGFAFLGLLVFLTFLFMRFNFFESYNYLLYSVVGGILFLMCFIGGIIFMGLDLDYGRPEDKKETYSYKNILYPFYILDEMVQFENKERKKKGNLYFEERIPLIHEIHQTLLMKK